MKIFEAVFVLSLFSMSSSSAVPSQCNYVKDRWNKYHAIDGQCRNSRSRITCSSSSSLLYKIYSFANCSGNPTTTTTYTKSTISQTQIYTNFECSKATCQAVFGRCGSSFTKNYVPGSCVSEPDLNWRIYCQGGDQIWIEDYPTADKTCSAVPQQYISMKTNVCLVGSKKTNISLCSGGPTKQLPSSYMKTEVYSSTSCSGTVNSEVYKYVNNSCSGGSKDFCSGDEVVAVAYEKQDCTGRMVLYRIQKKNTCQQTTKSITSSGLYSQKLVSCSGKTPPAKTFAGRVSIQKSYSGSTCQGPVVETSEVALGICSSSSATFSSKVTCNSTHMTQQIYGTADCTGRVFTLYRELKTCTNSTTYSSMMFECGLPLETSDGRQVMVEMVASFVMVVGSFLALM